MRKRLAMLAVSVAVLTPAVVLGSQEVAGAWLVHHFIVHH